MHQGIPFPDLLKAHLLRIADQRGYPIARKVLERGGAEELIVHSSEEAQTLVNIARMEMLDALLRYPFRDEDAASYDSNHENAFQDVQMGVFEKTAMYLGQVFDVVTTV